ncbi:Tfp pilus assembly protein PilW [Bhargavaea ullalensis]|uniref:Tfp pilus assembly protein PilW n=2 Tax=Bhargavaea ullalensis TaxID=1265685 RepID=A0ABV2G8L3_9BACL
MTLVELLAALVLVSLVVVLINTVFVFTQRNADSLSSETDVQANLLLGMKVLTKDIRSTDMDQVVVEKNKLILAGTEYTAKDGRLLKNGQTVAEDITSFETCRPPRNEVYSEDQLACRPIDTGDADKQRVIVILEGPPNRSGEKRRLATMINMER